MTKICHIKVCVLMTRVQSYRLCFNEKGGSIVCVLLTKVGHIVWFLLTKM